MIYYIDFDNTLFNTEKFYNDLLELIKKYDVCEKNINDYYNKFLSNELFNPIKIINIIIEKSSSKEQIKKEIDLFLKDLSMYLYGDTIGFLEYLNNKDYHINLLTYGDYEYQNIKINNSVIKKYFSKIIITTKNKCDLNLDYNNAIFIDDDIKQIKGLLNKNANVIRIRRNGNKHSINELKNVLEYETFNEYLQNFKDNK